VLSAVLAAAALFGSAQTGCAATVVRYEPSKFPSLSDSPWVLGKPASAGLLGAVVSYPSSLRDPRVNRSDGLVLWRLGGEIAWNQPGTLHARRLDGRGSFDRPLEGGGRSMLQFPSAGCWRLTLWNNSGFGSKIASVVARVVEVPKRLRCGATVLADGGWAIARPRSSGIKGGWPWQASGPAQLTTHGHDGDKNMKVPWWIKKGGPSLDLVGTRLDAVGTFHQAFPEALSPKGVYPSTVDIPAAGCWLLRLRTGRLAGVLVVRAVDARG
jgi:hypothetical protein